MLANNGASNAAAVALPDSYGTVLGTLVVMQWQGESTAYAKLAT
jgi:hypothetical protein